jgi:putative endonuclease
MIFSVYIITNKINGTLYIGITNDLKRRIIEHKLGLIDGFSKKYFFN